MKIMIAQLKKNKKTWSWFKFTLNFFYKITIITLPTNFLAFCFCYYSIIPSWICIRIMNADPEPEPQPLLWHTLCTGNAYVRREDPRRRRYCGGQRLLLHATRVRDQVGSRKKSWNLAISVAKPIHLWSGSEIPKPNAGSDGRHQM